MTLNNVKEVKEWLRNIPLVKAELTLKIKFYQELENEFNKVEDFEKSLRYYRGQIESLQHKMETLMEDVDRLFGILDENERLVMVARYINLIRWDYIEFHVFYSRRQAIRVHDHALLKLVGQAVGEQE